MSDELKPCPFCGFADEYIETTFMPAMSRAQSTIRCGFCGAAVHAHGKEAVILSWNERPAEDALRARLAACEEQRNSLASMLARYSRETGRAKAMHAKEFWLKQADTAKLEALNEC